MTEQEFYAAIGRYNDAYWLVRASLTLGAVWLLVDVTRQAGWAQVGIKVVLALASATAGVLYYGVFIRDLVPSSGEWGHVWLPGIRGGVFVLAGIVGVIDATTDSTRFVVPSHGWHIGAFFGLVALGLGYPAADYLAGHVYPGAQAYGIFPAPNLLFALAMLGIARTTGWVGKLWTGLTIALAIDTGIVLPITQGPLHNVIVGAGLLLSIAMLIASSPAEQPEQAAEAPGA